MKTEVEAFVARTGADELMITSQIFDHRARLKSYELLAGCFADDVPIATTQSVPA